MARSPDVLVVGAGMIGAGCAWRLSRRGLAVTLVDPDPVRGAWHTAAGMLAATTELHYTETDLLPLALDSLARYPTFVAELAEASGADTGYARTGTLTVAFDQADLAALRDLHAFGADLGLNATIVGSRELRGLEPALAPGLPGALLAPEDHQVDPRRLHRALLAASGADVVHAQVGSVRAGVVTLTDGTELAAGRVLVAAGAWTGALLPQLPPIRPVKGQTLRLHTDEAPLSHVIRASVKGRPVYVVPRPDGEIVVGATTEEGGFDLTARAGSVYELLRDAQTVVPELSEARFVESCTGLRPGSPGNAPLIGALPDGVLVATGHYRNGVLLAPVTADAITELVVDGALPEIARAFAPPIGVTA